MGEQGQSAVAIPARPRADFIVVQAHLARGLLQARLNRPPPTCYPYQLRERGLWRSPDAIVGTLTRRGQTAPGPDPGAPALARRWLGVPPPPPLPSWPPAS